MAARMARELIAAVEAWAKANDTMPGVFPDYPVELGLKAMGK